MRPAPSALVLVALVGITFAALNGLPGDAAKGVVLFVVAATVSWLIATGKLFAGPTDRD